MAVSSPEVLGRAFTKTGHDVRILPVQFVKSYLKANKNDFNDAEAIAEAGSRAACGVCR